MNKGFGLSIFLWFFVGSCSFQTPTNEPRTIKVIPISGIRQDEEKLNATYSYLLYLYHDSRGDIDLARNSLAKTIQNDSGSTQLKLRQAQDLFSRGLYASAREVVLKIKEENADAEKLFIQLLVREGNLSEARVALDKWLVKTPKDEEFHALRTRIEIEDQNLEAADKVIHNFLTQMPDSSQAYLLRGRVRQIRDHDKEALHDYRHSLELDPQNVTAAAHLAFLQDLMGKKDEALQTYVWLADATDSPEFHKRIGLLYLEKSDNRRAIAALEAYAKHQPQDTQNLARLAALYLEIKEYDQAEYKLKKLLSDQPKNDSIRYYYASALVELNKKALALDELQKIKRESLLFSEKTRLELQTMRDLGLDAKANVIAQNLATEMMAKGAERDESLYSILFVYFSQKKMKDFAKQILDRGVELYPNNNLLQYNLALYLDEIGQWKQALSVGQNLLKTDQKNPALLNLVGYILANQGIDLRKAEKLIDEALKARPDDPFIMDSKAWLRFKQNRYPEALEILVKIQALKPDEPIILVHTADVLAKMGRIQEALVKYEKALSLGIDPVHERLRVQEQAAKMQTQPNRKISGVE